MFHIRICEIHSDTMNDFQVQCVMRSIHRAIRHAQELNKDYGGQQHTLVIKKFPVSFLGSDIDIWKYLSTGAGSGIFRGTLQFTTLGGDKFPNIDVFFS